MKRSILLTILSVFLFASCADREKDLSVNVSKWNSLMSNMSSILNLEKDITELEGYAVLGFKVDNARNDIKESIAQYQGMKVEDDVIPMRDALIEYMNLADEELSYYGKIAEESKSKILTEDNLEEYYGKIDSLVAKMDEVEEKLTKAQKEFAKKHHITSYSL